MIYFLTIYSLVALLSLTDFIPKWRKAGAFFCVLLLSMLAGWRTMGGSDFFIYQDIYYGLGLNYFSAEAGYAFLSNIFSLMDFPFNGFLFFYSFISTALLMLFLEKHSPLPKFSLLIYLGCYFFFYNMVLNRQMFCMSMSLWVIYWWQKNRLYSLLCLILGMLFHQSLIVLLPFLLAYEMLQKTKGAKGWVSFFAVFILFTLLFSPEQVILFIGHIPGFSFVPNRLLGYLQHNSETYSLNIVEYFKILLVFIALIPSFKKVLRAKSMHIWLFMYFSGLIVLFWTRDIEILFRIFVYFDISLLILFPFCIQNFLAHMLPKQRELFLLGIYVFTGLLAIGAILYRTANFGDAVFWSYQFYFLV